jgi:homoserine acetyltransferase
VRVADCLGPHNFAVLGASGGTPYALTLRALAPERVGRVLIVSGMFEVDAEEIPGSQLRLYPRVGHLAIANHAEEIAETMLVP